MAALDFRTTSPHKSPSGPRYRRPLLLLFLIGVTLILTEQLQDANLRRSLHDLIAQSSGVSRHTDQAGLDGSSPISREELGPLEKAARNCADFPSLQDDTPSLAAERDLILQWFALLTHAGEDEIRRQSSGNVASDELLARTDSYRGRLISLSGVVRRVAPQQFAKDGQKLRGYYQLWLYPQNRAASPVVVCCLTLPAEFPISTKLAEQVNLTGFLVKRWAYQAQDGVRVAPLLLAGSLAWQRPGSALIAPPEELDFWLLVKILIPAVLLTVLGTWYAYRRTGSRRPTVQGRHPDFRALETGPPRPQPPAKPIGES